MRAATNTSAFYEQCGFFFLPSLWCVCVCVQQRFVKPRPFSPSTALKETGSSPGHGSAAKSQVTSGESESAPPFRESFRIMSTQAAGGPRTLPQRGLCKPGLPLTGKGHGEPGPSFHEMTQSSRTHVFMHTHAPTRAYSIPHKNLFANLLFQIVLYFLQWLPPALLSLTPKDSL